MVGLLLGELHLGKNTGKCRRMNRRDHRRKNGEQGEVRGSQGGYTAVGLFLKTSAEAVF